MSPRARTRSRGNVLWGGRRAQAIRAELRLVVEAGVACPFCRRPILPGQSWDVDHATPLAFEAEGLWDRSLMRPAHSRCNRAAGARLVNAKRGAATRFVF